MKKHISIALLAALAIWPANASAWNDGKAGAACTSSTTASSGYHHSKSGHASIPGKSIDHLRKMLKEADRIGLSEKQRKQLGELLIEAESKSAKAHAESEVAVAAFRSRLHSGMVTDKEVDAYLKRMGELRSASLAANLKASVAASRLLTQEQKSSLYTYKGAGAK